MQQQRISNTDGLITPAAYAKLKGLNRSTVCRQVQRGVIPIHDGLVNPTEADRCRVEGLHIRGRNTLRQRRERMAAEPPAELVPPGTTLVQVCDLRRRSYRDGQLATISDLRRPQNALTIAEVGLSLGCDLRQAVTLANWYIVLLGEWGADEDEMDQLEDHPVPDWAALAARIGEKVTVKEFTSWLKKSGAAFDRWDREHPQKPAATSGGVSKSKYESPGKENRKGNL